MQPPASPGGASPVLSYRDPREDEPRLNPGDVIGLIVSVGTCLFFLMSTLILVIHPPPLRHMPVLGLCAVCFWLSSLTLGTYAHWLRHGHPPR